MTATIYDFHSGREITGGLESTLQSDQAVYAARTIAVERNRAVVLEDFNAHEVERVMFPSIQVEAEGYIATLRGDHVDIARRDGVWVGSGDWYHELNTIMNCDAQLGDTPHDGTDARQRESERIYEALDKALAAATATYTEEG